MESTITIYGIVIIVSGVLSIILFFKIWGMTDNVRAIKDKITYEKPQDYRELVLKGKKEEAFELLKCRLVDRLEWYIDYYYPNVDAVIGDTNAQKAIDKYAKAAKSVGFQLPEYLQGIEKYVEYRKSIVNI